MIPITRGKLVKRVDDVLEWNASECWGRERSWSECSFVGKSGSGRWACHELGAENTLCYRVGKFKKGDRGRGLFNGRQQRTAGGRQERQLGRRMTAGWNRTNPGQTTHFWYLRSTQQATEHSLQRLMRTPKANFAGGGMIIRSLAVEEERNDRRGSAR